MGELLHIPCLTVTSILTLLPATNFQHCLQLKDRSRKKIADANVGVEVELKVEVKVCPGREG
jgi:hypothetical protein